MPRAIMTGYGYSNVIGGWGASAEIETMKRQLATTDNALNASRHLVAVLSAGLSAERRDPDDVAATGAAVLARTIDPTDTLGDLDFMPVKVAETQRPARIGSLTLMKLPDYSVPDHPEIYYG